MSQYTSKATVVLDINGRQAQKMLKQLESEAQRLEKELAKATSAGNKANMKKYQRELTQTRRLIDQMKGSATSVDNTLRRLDKASPKELNRTLKTLQTQLNGIQRGTAAWDAHVEKIRAVKAEINAVNATMREQESGAERILGWFNKWQTAILAAGAALTGLIMAGKSAVSAYADMEQEEANVRKFTGMSAEEVAALNEEFKKIDTRTSREDLNKLAQEAGRLGKTSQEDVLGFVRAADKINVALDDLGEGATLTLSKLTGIFGDEQRLGTEKALLSVGSVINELSQNCSASAPYIAQFASRMGGVGAQAGMTVQQIMGFAAVLDSNNQKLEASSTALSQVIVRIYQDPAKYARVAGMDVERFSNLVKTDMNQALIEFLGTLQQAGGMDQLSPMFKDMGENGSRAISALSTLATHIEDVKNQQLVANEAFEEAVSIDNEFDVQNNTVQAGLEKARKRVKELAIELGEKLMPIMRFFISSTTIAIKVLGAIVDFFIKYKREITFLAVSIAAYTVVAKASAVATTLWSGVTKAASAAAAMARTMVLALKIGYYQLTGQVTRAEAATKLFNATSKASPWGIIIGMATAAAGAIYSMTTRIKDARAEAKRAAEEYNEWKKSITDLDEKSAEYSAKEITRLDALYNEATDEAAARDKRRTAAEKLQELYPDIFKNLSTEEIMVGKAKDAYNDLRDSIIEVARARAAAEKITDNEKELLTLEQKTEGLKSKMDSDKAAYDKAVKEQETARDNYANSTATNSSDAAANYIVHVSDADDKVISTGNAYKSSKAAYEQNQRKIKELEDANAYLVEKYKISAEALEEHTEPEIEIPDPDPLDLNKPGRFDAEEDWRKQEEAMARISYATGETDYIAYTKRMDEIAVEFYERQLLHTDLTETERLEILAQWREAQLKQQEHFTAASIETEEKRYNTEQAMLKQSYINGSISKETYDQKLEEMEIEHQQILVSTTKAGTKERLQAEQQLQALQIAQMQRRQQEVEKLEAKYAAMKNDYFGDNPAEAQAKYDADLKLLDVVYKRERAAAVNNAVELLRIDEAYEKAKLALKKKYGLLAEEDTRNAMERGIASSLEWLQGDGGKALSGTMNTLVSGMSAIFSQLSSVIQAELEIQTAAINKRYETEMERAQGNSYKIRKLEKDKEKEIAKAKAEANRKMFAMQVIQAVAQTATNALNAYGSAAAVPVVGYILAPIAAAMAVAAGAIQIAAIKKQQQASESQGYKAGGFTPEGSADEVAGVVHKGEWVASQALVNNPRTRPLLEALDYAQRTNTIGSITSADVSRTITAPALLAAQPSSTPPTIVNNFNQSTSSSADFAELSATIRELRQRLSEPFVTVNTVTGDHGINKAQEEYDKLMRNKTPKSKR